MPATRRRRARDSRADPWGGRVAFEESFKIVRSNLEVALSDLEQPTVVVTSSKANEGKTVICTKLALSFAQAGLRVVLVDLDLRHSTAHQLLRSHNEFGVSDVLLGRRSLQECLQKVEIPPTGGRGPHSIYFLGTGPPVENPTELLASARTARVLDGLAKQADLVLLDTPPVLPVADTLVIGRIASGAILVVEAGTTAYGAVAQTKDLLIRNQTRLLGVVINKFHLRDAELAYGYPGYGYGYWPEVEGGDHVDQQPPEAAGDGEGRRGNGSANDGTSRLR